MSEERLWEYIRNGMKHKWEAQRHEDKYSTGIPDISYSTNHHGWIELKYLKSKPSGHDTVMRIKHYTAQQRNWLKKHGRKGGKCFILLQVDKCYMIFTWDQCAIVGSTNYDGHINVAKKIWQHSINWDELLEILNG